MSPAPRGSGRRAVFYLLGGSILFCLLLLGWLFPSLRQYRSKGPGAGAPGAIGAPGTVGSGDSAGVRSAATTGRGHAAPADGQAGGAPPDSARGPALLGGTATGAAPAVALIVSEESEGGGRVQIEPAPFQPPPEPVHAPPAELPPEVKPADTTPAATTAGEASSTRESAAGTEAPVPAPVLEPPVVLKAAWLRYPEEARKKRREGSVEVRILVAETGGVTDVQLVAGAGDSALDNAALNAARSTLFRPAHLGEQAVAVWYNYRFVFSVPKER